MQGKFSQNFENFRLFAPLFPCLSVPAAAFALLTALGTVEGLVDEDNIAAKALDTLPRDVEVLSPAEEAEEAAGAENHDALDAALRDADLHIPHIAQPAAVADIDDLLAPHQCKAIDHSIPPQGKLM